MDQSNNLDALMAQLADGDRSAFTPAFRLLWPPVRRMCAALTTNAADADDATQSAMEKVLVRASDYDASRPALPWALAIAGWECRTLKRRRHRRKETSDDAVPSLGGVMQPEEVLAQRDLIQAALGAMQQLSESDQETLLATF